MSGADDALTSDEQLADTTERTSYTLVPIDAALLGNPAVLRAIAGIGIGLAVLLWPNRTDRILARLVGIALVWFAVTGIRAALKRRPRGWLSIVVGIAAFAEGTLLLLTPDRSATVLGRAIGIVILAVALRDLVPRFRPHDDRAPLAPIIALVAAGGLLLAFPEEVLAAATTVTAVAWIAISLLVVVISLDARTTGTTSYSGAGQLVVAWLNDRPKSVDDRQDLYAKILFEGPNTKHRVARFFALMGFAAVIASMGVLSDSTAVVIGAMLIAPLMTPLMGMAISLVMGWPTDSPDRRRSPWAGLCSRSASVPF